MSKLSRCILVIALLITCSSVGLVVVLNLEGDNQALAQGLPPACVCSPTVKIESPRSPALGVSHENFVAHCQCGAMACVVMTSGPLACFK
jgi:hypothetical protein